MKISKITKKQLIDVAIRVLKTFVAAGAVAVAGMGFSNPKAWLYAFGTGGATGVINLIIKLFKEED